MTVSFGREAVVDLLVEVYPSATYSRPCRVSPTRITEDLFQSAGRVSEGTLSNDEATGELLFAAAEGRARALVGWLSKPSETAI
jgi:hypothetical protein